MVAQAALYAFQIDSLQDQRQRSRVDLDAPGAFWDHRNLKSAPRKTFIVDHIARAIVYQALQHRSSVVDKAKDMT
jgi:hypothetical protein